MEILKELAEWRKYNNMTLEDLARELRVPYGSVQRWCSKCPKKIMKPYVERVTEFLDIHKFSR